MQHASMCRSQLDFAVPQICGSLRPVPLQSSFPCAALRRQLRKMEATWALIVMLLLMLGLFLIVAFFAIGMRDRRIVLDGGERLRTRESSSVKMEKAQKEGALRVEEVSEMKIVEEGMLGRRPVTSFLSKFIQFMYLP